MADRIFAAALLMVTLAYAIIAFTRISAPFQYDPLGPESWPRILALIALLCLIQIIWKPDVEGLEVNRPTVLRLLFMVALMIAYAELYEPVGFIISTILFGAITARMLGASLKHSVVFGLSAGIGGYLLCAVLLDLNVPEGDLVEALLEWGGF